ncbi:hypothetical protein KIOSHI_235 [Bacillus phage Kioshi]|nr:hypothetical protein KIOSHI_235 [Bacillus phage Kioshi]
MDNLYVILSLQDNKEVKHLKYQGLLIGLGLVFFTMACIGVWFVCSTWESGKFYLILGTLATIGASYLASLLVEEK